MEEPARNERSLNAKVRRAVAMVNAAQHNGNQKKVFSRVAKMLAAPNTDRRISSDELIAKLQRLHPKAPVDRQMPNMPIDAPLPNIVEDKFVEHLRRVCNGSAPGPSGWSFELVASLLDNPLCVRGLVCIARDIAGGKLDARFKEYLLSSRVVGIPKGEDDVRPISIGEVLIRATASYVSFPCIAAAAELFKPMQLA